jgi:phenylpropionate dioxygenase-like ring-hydroxylating dioxygenase large terminal subunit
MVGDGNCSRMRCPFHFWTYGLDGRLLGAPSMQRTAGFDRADHGLHEFALVERHGFVFVSLEESPPPIDGWLGDFGEVHEPWALADMVTTRRREFTVDCNWKGFAEVFNEYYHLPYVHPGSIDSTYDDPDEPDVVVGAYATHFGTTQGTGGLLVDEQHRALPLIDGLPDREAHGVRYSWLFPNLVIATGAEGMWMYEVYPDGPDRCRCAQVVCFPPTTIARPDFAEVAEAYYERFDVAISEDIPVLEQQHLGMRSPFSRQGRFSYLEPSVARFAAWYAERLLSAG